MRKHYRQGDVLLIEVETIPKEARVLARGELVLARGEATGHAHRIVDEGAVLLAMRPERSGAADGVALSPAESATFVRLARKAQLVHEEHGTIDIPLGAYRIVRQREYMPGEIRRVSD